MNTRLKLAKRWQARWLSVSLLSIAFTTIAECRPWKPTENMMAQDYATILDQRGKGDLVMLMWLVPESMPEQQLVARDILSKYIVLGALHAHVDAVGTFSFDQIDSLQVSDTDGRTLVALDDASMPPAITGTLATMQAVMGQAAGPFGRGFHWFVYRGGSLRSCQKGVLTVQFAGETYTYDTPIPGCPKS
jgi:hypothetical protein